ncbi:MAG: TonB-dependent receptor [Candidatus Thiodiazotropha sp.]
MLNKKIDTMGITMQHCRNTTMLANYLFLLFILVFSQYAISADCTHVARLVSLEGSVEKKLHDQEVWREAALEDQFCAGDALRTLNNGRAAVRLANDTLLRLDRDSALTFSQVEESTPSLLDLLRGAVHFISRTPQSLKIKTPYVNASIEGTEFVIRIQDGATEVTVLEGFVIASNQAGSIDLKANQAGRASADQQPVLIEIARPFDAVVWALYYPPLPEIPGEADSLARQAINAIVQNRLEDAAALAKQALDKDSQSAAAYMAQSYVDQAMFDIPAALLNSQQAADLAPQNALTQARLAEVRLMTGDTSAARDTAEQATSLDPNLSLAHTVLGFSSLRDVSLEAAGDAFSKAIALDSTAPLPRLGLGLLKIREGDLQAGRQEIETATLLDPNNALLRSYMGKTYYEEKRGDLASEQLAMAKVLDPNDPTAWYYDSILLHSQNRPVEALRAQQKAIELNDHRGVYRSRQLLDQDEAARNTASARIYTDLGFEKMAINEGTKALIQDPGNFSAHRFMADINATQPQRRLAVESELLQSKLLQPLIGHTLRPQLSDLQLADGPARFSYNEFNPLFNQSGPSLLINGFAAGNSTWGDDIIASFLGNRFSISLAQYHYESDGFRDIDWIDKDTLTAFAQFNVTPDTMLQLELSEDTQENGYLNQHFFTDTFAQPDFSSDAEREKVRFGIRHYLSPNSQLIGNIAHQEFTSDQMTFQSEINGDDEFDTGEVQWLYSYMGANFIVGGNITDFESTSTVDRGPVNPLLVTQVEQESSNIYIYSYFPLMENIHFTAGGSYTKFDATTTPVVNLPDGTILNLPEEKADESQFNPKIGLSWDLQPNTTLRFSAFRNGRNFTELDSLEPTQVAGFNQVFDDFSSKVIIDSKRYGLAIDHIISQQLFIGASINHAERTSSSLRFDPILRSTVRTNFDTDRDFAEAYLYYAPNEKINLTVELDYEDYNEPRGALPPVILSLETYRLPIGIKYRYLSNLIFELTGTFYDQKGNFLLPNQSELAGEDDFWLFDGNITYNLPKRYGKLTLGAKNILDTSYDYEDRLNNTSFLSEKQGTNLYELTDERLIYGKFTLTF